MRKPWRTLLLPALLAALLLSATAPGALAAPPNDDFAAAQALDGASGSVDFDLSGATSELAEPMPSGGGGSTIWFSFTASGSGLARFSTCSEDSGATIDGSSIAAYTGGSLASLGVTAGATGGCRPGSVNSAITLLVEDGTTYWIQVGASALSAVTAGTLGWEMTTELAANDDFAAAQQLAGDRGETQLSLVGASNESGEPLPGAPTDQTVWFEYSPSASGTARFSTCTDQAATEIDGIHLALFGGADLQSLSSVADSGGGCPNGRVNAVVEAPVSAGEHYWLQVSAAADTWILAGDLAYDFNTAVPANDDYSTAAEIPATLPATIAADNGLATTEDGEPDLQSWGPRNSLWYSWTPDADGEVMIDTCTTSWSDPAHPIDSRLEMYKGGVAGLADLSQVASNDDGCPAPNGLLSKFYLYVIAGTTYHLRLANYSADFGAAYTLRLLWVAQLENISPPVIQNDDHKVGVTLDGAGGRWIGPQTDNPALTYEWQRCDTSGNDCSTIDGESGSQYTPTAADIGSTVRLRVTADDGLSSVSAQSEQTQVIDSVPANDDIAQATDLGSDAELYVHDDANFATTELDETGQAGQPVQHTVWYRWTAPSSGDFAVGTCADAPQDDSLDLSVAVFSGDGTIAGDTLEAGAGAGCGGNARARTRLVATAGTVYWIQVDSATDFPAAFTLAITPAAAPFFQGNAAITGTPIEGGALHAEAGNYQSALEAGLAYEWWLCDANGDNCEDTGENTADYPVGAAAVGKRAKIVITLANEIGSVQQEQLSTAIAADADGDGAADDKDVCLGETGTDPPGNGCQPSQVVNDAAPAISGTPQAGEPLAASSGVWHTLHNPLALSYEYSWSRCTAADDATCSVIGGATLPAYTPTAADVGTYLVVSVTAQNAEDSGSALSAFVGPVAASPNNGGGGSGGGTTPPADPLPSLSLPKSLGTVKLKAGRIKLTKLNVTCGAGASGPCTGTIAITVGGRRTTIKLRVKPGARLATSFRLSSAAQKKVKKGRKARAKIRLALGGPGFSVKTASTTVSIKR